jgi:anaerobic selenocysteine-containing dehydrogenase
VAPQATLQLSPADAAKLGVAENDKVTVSASGASVSLPVQIKQEIPAGLAVSSNHFRTSCLNSLMTKPAASLSVTVTKS